MGPKGPITCSRTMHPSAGARKKLIKGRQFFYCSLKTSVTACYLTYWPYGVSLPIICPVLSMRATEKHKQTNPHGNQLTRLLARGLGSDVGWETSSICLGNHILNGLTSPQSNQSFQSVCCLEQGTSRAQFYITSERLQSQNRGLKASATFPGPEPYMKLSLDVSLCSSWVSVTTASPSNHPV